MSPALLAELARALGYPKLARLIPNADADAFVAWIARAAVVAADLRAAPPISSSDPNDDYLLTLAVAEHAVLVSGDGHLTALAGRFPCALPPSFSPRSIWRVHESFGGVQR